MNQRQSRAKARSRASHAAETRGPQSKAGRHTARTVLDVMSPDLASCFPDANLVEVARLMVADRDIVCRTIAEARNPLELTAQDCMSAPAVTVTPDVGLDECCHLLEEHMIRRVPVVDDGGRCCGIVSQADLATKASKSLTAEMVRQVSRPAQSASATAGT
jgi:CBS domain-containing protein